jgi:hypothetical protein
MIVVLDTNIITSFSLKKVLTSFKFGINLSAFVDTTDLMLSG